jgi:hypothetical protein
MKLIFLITFFSLLSTLGLAQNTPDFYADPAYGSIKLASGFTPDPWTKDLIAGGSFDLTVMGYDGFVATAPDIDINYYASTAYSLTFSVESDSDTILLVYSPAGEWHFSDDENGLNPSVYISTPTNGVYSVWIGTYNSDTVEAVFNVSEL